MAATVWAKIQNDVVVNLQMCEPGDVFDPNFVWVDLQDNPNKVGIGWLYESLTKIFLPPPLDGL